LIARKMCIKGSSGEGRGEVNFYREDGGEVNEFHEGLGGVR
jgi:hypothetical protein